jgi:gas vesicle protein
MNNTGKIALGIVSAAAIGTFLGLLVAPQKGSKLQKNIAKRGSEVINQLIDFVLRKQKETKSGNASSRKTATTAQHRTASTTRSKK